MFHFILTEDRAGNLKTYFSFFTRQKIGPPDKPKRKCIQTFAQIPAYSLLVFIFVTLSGIWIQVTGCSSDKSHKSRSEKIRNSIVKNASRFWVTNSAACGETKEGAARSSFSCARIGTSATRLSFGTLLHKRWREKKNLARTSWIGVLRAQRRMRRVERDSRSALLGHLSRTHATRSPLTLQSLKVSGQSE